MKWLVREVIVVHDLATDKSLKRQCREHVETETKPCHVDHDVVGRKVVEDITLCLVPECKKSRERHCHACNH